MALFSATVHPSGRLIVGVDEVAQDGLHLTDRLTSRANARCREVVVPGTKHVEQCRIAIEH